MSEDKKFLLEFDFENTLCGLVHKVENRGSAAFVGYLFDEIKINKNLSNNEKSNSKSITLWGAKSDEPKENKNSEEIIDDSANKSRNLDSI